MSISKDKSLQFANILLANKKKKVDEMEKFVSNLVRQEYVKTLPEKVVAAFSDKDINQFMINGTGLSLCGNGYNWHHLSIESAPKARNTSDVFQPSKAVAERLKKHTDKLDTLKKDLKESRNKLQAAIFGLRTPKRILEVFPELESQLGALEKPQTAVINVKEIRSLIK
jgi:hypothetical protein